MVSLRAFKLRRAEKTYLEGFSTRGPTSDWQRGAAKVEEVLDVKRLLKANVALVGIKSHDAVTGIIEDHDKSAF